MEAPSELDLKVRLQLSGMKYSDWMDDYIKALKYGKRNIIEIQNKLFLLNVYIEIMLDYKIYTGCSNTNTNNCLTEIEISDVFEKVSTLTGICFQPYGFNYIGDEKQGGIGKMQIGCSFVVS
jgi:hypothetical protein